MSHESAVSQESAVKSQLDEVIQPEISGDKFYRAIRKIAAMPEIRTILEIGASSGGGSTEAFVAGAVKRETPPDIYSIEVSKVRFANLVERWKGMPFVHPYNVSSVPVARFPSEEEVTRFWNETDSHLRRTPLAEVLRWLRQDIDYIRDHAIPQEGIRQIKQESGIAVFDAVLIDGSEFTGAAELDEVYGARFILLDDILSYKNYDAHARLSRDTKYKLWKKGLRTRNGFSIFERV